MGFWGLRRWLSGEKRLGYQMWLKLGGQSFGKKPNNACFIIKNVKFTDIFQDKPGWFIFQWFHFIAFTGMYFCPVPLYSKPYWWWLNDFTCCECFQTSTSWNNNPPFSSFSNHHRHPLFSLSCPLQMLISPTLNWNWNTEFPMSVYGHYMSWYSFQKHFPLPEVLWDHIQQSK